MGALIAIQKWITDTSKDNFRLKDETIHNIVIQTILKGDKTKVHINGPNFFEKYYKRLEDSINNSLDTTIKKDESMSEAIVSFDSKMIEAIKRKIKTEFRIIDNLDVVNLNPNEWMLKGWENNKGAILMNVLSNEKVIINFPYKLGDILKLNDLAKSQTENLFIKIDYAGVRRIQDFDMNDASKEGIGIYETEIEKIYARNPAADAEVDIFKMIWKNKHGAGSLMMNYWIWVYGFNLYI